MDRDTSEYSSTKAPETRPAAEQKDDTGADPRLIPGGAEPKAQGDPGMTGLDEDAVPAIQRTPEDPAADCAPPGAPFDAAILSAGDVLRTDPVVTGRHHAVGGLPQRARE